jgi:hypothetical protein
MAAGAVLYAGCAITAVKGFANTYYKNKESVAKGIICRKDREGKRRRKELITSLIRVELRRL